MDQIGYQVSRYLVPPDQLTGDEIEGGLPRALPAVQGDAEGGTALARPEVREQLRDALLIGAVLLAEEGDEVAFLEHEGSHYVGGEQRAALEIRPSLQARWPCWCMLARMRRAISFVVASMLLFGSTYALWFLLTQADRFRGWMVMMAALTLIVGGYWLWEDYINPARGKDTTDG